MPGGAGGPAEDDSVDEKITHTSIPQLAPMKGAADDAMEFLR